MLSWVKFPVFPSLLIFLLKLILLFFSLLFLILSIFNLFFINILNDFFSFSLEKFLCGKGILFFWYIFERYELLESPGKLFEFKLIFIFEIVLLSFVNIFVIFFLFGYFLLVNMILLERFKGWNGIDIFLFDILIFWTLWVKFVSLSVLLSSIDISFTVWHFFIVY